MEIPSNTPMMPSASKNGFLIGLSLIGLQLIIQYFLSENQALQMLLTLLIMISGLQLSIVNYRDKFNGGNISYGRSVRYGALVALLSGVILAAFVYILLQYIEPTLMDKLIIASEENIEKTVKNQAEQEKMLELNRAIMNPGTIALGSVINNLIFGVLLSLIIGIFTKRQSMPNESQQENSY